MKVDVSVYCSLLRRLENLKRKINQFFLACRWFYFRYKNNAYKFMKCFQKCIVSNYC